MSRLSSAVLRPARPLRTVLAGGVLALSLATPTTTYAAGPASAGALPGSLAGIAASAATSPAPTPSCKEWQTITHVPVRPGVTPTAAPDATATPTVPMRAVCRNAPPTPFSAPVWDPSTVVGGERLAATGVVVDKPDAVPAPPDVEDVSYVLADMDSGAILAAKSPHAWLRPASTLKTLTALTLLPLVPRDKVITATTEHVRANGTRVGMIVGNPYTAAHLFQAMLMLSANDASYALADAAGGFDKALELMNAKAQEIGAHDTVALDPSGLDEDGQHSSAYDLALIGRAAMQREDFRAYIVKRQARFPGGIEPTSGKAYSAFQYPNINELLGNYAGAIGIKPGRTNRAQHTFIGAATRDGRTLIVTQMGSTSGSWKDTAALLDWGFAHAGAVTPVGRLVEPGEAAPPVERIDAPQTSVPASTPALTPAATGTPAPPVSSSWSALADEVKEAAPLEVVAGAALLLVLAVLLAVAGRRRRRSDPRLSPRR